MEKKILELIPADQFLIWFLIFLVVAFFIYKEWPEFWKRVQTKTAKDQKDLTIEGRMDSIEKKLDSIESKLERDYDRINILELEFKRSKNAMAASQKESEIMMRAMLNVLKSLQELGSNGSTNDSQVEIQNWLNEQSHKTME